ncbi:class I SAM-dependent methyltransferase [Sulfuricaulis sp.]|jgi:SAM-dependent methyltransferase|uniref:class I SAM-dependent methyltransferase n=1 Tax=Sulfuricaulis sp. TaxID=2003553 RepID=UPI0035599366
MSDKSHWEKIYTNKRPAEVSWHQTHLEKSRELIRATGVGHDAKIIDVGGGASTLVDDLLADGFRHITVMDISPTAIQSAQARLGARAREIVWLEADATRGSLPAHHYDVWHDRAVFHFLTDAKDRRRYVDNVSHALKPGGYVIVATFGPNGPLKCSGLDIVRYTSEQLHAEFGEDFQLLRSAVEDHVTPAGKHQEFVYCCCRKR